MSVNVFLDTNIIIYLYSKFEINKRNIAYDLVNNSNCFISTQTMNESCNIWYKKYNLNKIEISKYLTEIEAVCDRIMPINRETINLALDLKEKYNYSYYDCLILASAIEANCDILFSEDMTNGQIINNILKIVNPFKD